MKRTISIALCCILSTMLAFSAYLGDVNGDGAVTIADVTHLVNIVQGSITEFDSTLADVNQNGKIETSDIEALVDMILTKTLVEVSVSDTLYIYYTEGTATYQKPTSWSDVSVTVNGGHVTVDNTNETTERVTVLSGTCSNGSFSYNGTYKTTLRLNGLTLTNTSGAAIDIQDGKRVSLEMADGTTNTLTDGSNGSQKAALYCKGHLEISKGGTLVVTGNTKHAISANEYIEIKETTGTITISGALSDGIHAGQYFLMNGGTITMENVWDDGIQAEASLEGEQDDGKMMINGGYIDITLQGTDVAALKCDSLLTITDGNITIHADGYDIKGIKSKSDINITGGTIDITQTGYYIFTEVTNGEESTYDASFTTGIKAGGNISIEDTAHISINNTADGGRGINADGNITIHGDADIDITANGAGGVLETAEGSTSTSNSYRFYITLPSTATSNSGGGMQPPGGQSGSTISWGNPILYKSDGTQVATLADQVSISDGSSTASFFYYDFGTLTSGNYYITASYSITGQSQGGMGGPGGGGSTTTTGTYTSGTINLNLTGSDVFYAVTAASSGNYRPGQSASYTFSISDVTSTYSNGIIATQEGDTFSASCLKSDGNIILSGGTLTLSHSGDMSKGIKADGKVTLNGASVTDTALGKYMVAGSDISYCTAVKCGSYEGTAGSLTVLAIGQASRGISSDSTIDISGGSYELTLSGDGLTNPNDSSDGIASVGFKSDSNMQLLAGNITINNTAKGGKGIKVGTSEVSGANGASLIIGQSGTSNDLLTLDVNTTNTYIATESGSSGGWGGGPTDGGFIGSTKAIKVMGPITVNSGNIHLSTTSDGAEGLESKHTITFNGGIFESDTYDDAINAGDCITFNDGYVWAHASGNDAIDSNSSSGTNGIVINGGVVIGTSTTSPEEAFDCDNANFILNGGVVIGVGGAQGGGTSTAGAPTSASQKYGIVSGVSLTQNTYISVKNSSGIVLCNYKQPNSFSSGGGMGGNSGGVSILVSHPNLGNSATVTYNATGVSGASDNVWDGIYTTGGTVSGGTSTSATVH